MRNKKEQTKNEAIIQKNEEIRKTHRKSARRTKAESIGKKNDERSKDTSYRRTTGEERRHNTERTQDEGRLKRYQPRKNNEILRKYQQGTYTE